MRDDAELVESALNGGPAAFGPIVDRYRDAVFGVALARLRDVHDAEDVAQNVFVEAYQRLGKLRKPSRLGVWLRVMAINRSLDLLRKRKETVALEHVAEVLPDPDRGEGQRDLREEVMAAIARLSTVQRETVTLFYINGYSVAEVAQMQDVPEGTVKGRLHDARQKLKDELMQSVESVLKSAAPKGDFGARVLGLLSRRGKPAIPPWSKEWKAIEPQLRKIGPQGIEGYRRGLASPHGPTRLFAIKMIGHTGPDVAEDRIELLKKSLGDSNKLVRRHALAALLGQGSWERRCREFVPLVVPLMNDRSVKVRRTAVDMLIGFREAVPLAEVSVAAAAETVPYARRMKACLAWIVAEGYGGPMRSADWHDRWFALRGMLRRPFPLDEERMQLLERAVRDPMPVVRSSGLWGLQQVLQSKEPAMRERAVSAVMYLLGDRSPRTRSFAAWVLREFVPELPGEVVTQALARERDPETRRHLEAMAQRQ